MESWGEPFWLAGTGREVEGDVGGVRFEEVGGGVEKDFGVRLVAEGVCGC